MLMNQIKGYDGIVQDAQSMVLYRTGKVQNGTIQKSHNNRIKINVLYQRAILVMFIAINTLTPIALTPIGRDLSKTIKHRRSAPVHFIVAEMLRN